VTTLIQFLEERLRADEAAALAWPEDQRDWAAAGKRHLSYASGLGEQMGAVNVGGDYYGWERIYVKSDLDGDLTGYLALHDPARVLREVTAKRRVMARHRPDQDGSELTWNRDACLGCGGHERWEHTEPNVEDVNNCPELRDLAAVYSDHQDFREEWAA
jgi:hypothetical protein